MKKKKVTNYKITGKVGSSAREIVAMIILRLQ